MASSSSSSSSSSYNVKLQSIIVYGGSSSCSRTGAGVDYCLLFFSSLLSVH
jgi:hypothetical protein